jgi:predicted dehydrogenase
MTKIRWGVLGGAKIAIEKVIPAMQSGTYSEVTAIASRDSSRIGSVAASLGIPKAYGSYERLLDDPDVDAVYIPLPNHLHVPWTIRAAEAGKHVLCEKPIALNAEDARKLLEVRERTGVVIQEAFMVKTHPQWLKVAGLIESERIGELRAITGFFSYFNRDPENIRNNPTFGGGAIFDIGCYPIFISRWIFGEDPIRVMAMIDEDPEMKIDRLASAILDFPSGQATFTCSTQLVPHQRMQFLGTRGRIEVEIPFNIPVDTPTRIFIDDGSDLYGGNVETIEIGSANQYTIQGDEFSKVLLGEGAPPIPLEFSICNMAVIDAVFRSARTRNWEAP